MAFKVRAYNDRCAACDLETRTYRVLCKQGFPCKIHMLTCYHSTRECQYCGAGWIELAKNVTKKEVDACQDYLTRIQAGSLNSDNPLIQALEPKSNWSKLIEAIIILILSLANRVSGKPAPAMPEWMEAKPLGWKEEEK